MKKICKVCLSLIFVFSASLMFFACKNEVKTLSSPVSVGLVNNEVFNENNEYLKTEILLVTDKNKYAKSYRFYITDSTDHTNVDNYISFSSNTNFVDITDYFNSRKVYYYFVQYIGGKNYKDSKFSQTKVYTPKIEPVETPYVQLLNEQLSWFKISNANGYEVYEETLDINNEVVDSKVLINNLDSETLSIDLSNRFNAFDAPYKKFRYSIKATASGFYSASDFSNSVTYIKDITLSAPTNLNVTKEENKYYLNWNKVDYCSYYEVVINGNTQSPVVASENKLEITEYLTNYATFSFAVKAKESEAISYTESGYSETLNYDYTKTLSKPENIEVSREGEYINVSFSEVNLAQTYTLSIIHNGSEVYNTINLENTNVSLEIKAILGELTKDENIIIKIKANKVSNYILESEYESVDYTVLKDIIVEEN